MHDGVVIMLTNVRHVPELKKNLIYVGVLDSGGCKIVTQNGEMKVVQGNLVAMKDGAFKEFCDQEGIVGQWTVRKLPQQNGVTEKLNHPLREKSIFSELISGLTRNQNLLKSELISELKAVKIYIRTEVRVLQIRKTADLRERIMTKIIEDMHEELDS
ncbi:hypothetical protein AgCh_006228 [Apium graveolens]